MINTIVTDQNDNIKIRATVSATWEAFGLVATPEELTWAINSQAQENEALTVAQVKRSMKELGEPQTAGSNHYRRTHYYTSRPVNHRWQRS